MSLPLPNLGNPLASLGASMAISQQGIRSASQLTQRTTQAFGDLLSQLNPLAANGPLEANSQLTSNQLLPSDGLPSDQLADSSYSDRLKSFRSKLTGWLDATCKRLGLQRDSQPLDIRLDSEQQLDISGPEPLRSELRAYIEESEELTKELQDLQKSQPSPLQWLPAGSSKEPTGIPSANAPTRFDPLLIQL